MSVALLTGATGFVGSHLVQALCEQGWTVRVLAMPQENTADLERAGVTVYRGDVQVPESLTKPMRGADVVFHLAGIHGLWRPRSEYYAVNVGGTRNVCRAVLDNGVSRLVHVSSWTVYGMDVGEVMHEDMPLRPLPDSYTLSKAEADTLVQHFVERDSLPATIVRPGTMLGPRDRVNFGRMADRLMRRRAVLIGGGENVLPFVYVSNVVDGMILAASRDEAVGQIYNLSDDRPLTQAQLWSAIAEEIGAPAPRFRVPYGALNALGWICERIVSQDRPRWQPMVTRLGVKLFGSDNRVTIDKARHELGYSPQITIREGVRLAAAWYMEETRDTACAVKRSPRNVAAVE